MLIPAPGGYLALHYYSSTQVPVTVTLEFRKLNLSFKVALLNSAGIKEVLPKLLILLKH